MNLDYLRPYLSQLRTQSNSNEYLNLFLIIITLLKDLSNTKEKMNIQTQSDKNGFFIITLWNYDALLIIDNNKGILKCTFNRFGKGKIQVFGISGIMDMLVTIFSDGCVLCDKKDLNSSLKKD